MVPTPPEFVEEAICQARHGAVMVWLRLGVGTVLLLIGAAGVSSIVGWNAAVGLDTHIQVQRSEAERIGETLDRIEKQSEHQHEVLQEILTKIGGP